MGYFILAPVLLADYKSAIVTCTAADCKSAETGSFLRFLIRNRFFRSCAGPFSGLQIRNSYLYGGGLQIRRNKRGLQSSVGVPADLKSTETSGGFNPP